MKAILHKDVVPMVYFDISSVLDVKLTKRKPIEPSARKGIHDHHHQSETAMKYKYCDNEENSETETDDENNDTENMLNGVQGKDVVDFSRHSSKKAKAKKIDKGRPIRRNSLNSSYNSEPSNERLAQSLPTTFTTSFTFNDRWQPPNLLNTSSPPILESPKQYNTSDHNKRVDDKKGIRKLTILFMLIITSFIAVGAKIWWVEDEKSNVSNTLYDIQKFNNELFSIGEQYNINEDSILQIKSGISAIFQNQDAGSFIFVYNSNTKGFNKSIFNNLIKSISSATARYLRNDNKFTQQVQHIEIEPLKLAVETHSELIQKYRDDVSRAGLLLVKDIDKLPSNLAMAFHYYCDEYNPLVKGSAIFFTLDIANCSAPAQQQASHAYIEKCLAKKWTSVPKDNIGPLLTRVVGTIVDTSNPV